MRWDESQPQPFQAAADCCENGVFYRFRID